MNYQYYHTHPLNKLIHFFCIPLIVLTTFNYLTYYTNNSIKFSILACLIFHYGYKYNLLTSFVMYNYFFIIRLLSNNWLTRENCLRESFWIFIISWTLQFCGHIIEGNRPALFTSLIQSFIEAPLFSIQYILPFRIH